MKINRIILVVLLLSTLLFFLSGCSDSKAELIYEGILENVQTTKNITTITFANKIAVTKYYDGVYGDAVLIFGNKYDLFQRTIIGDTKVYLKEVK